MWSRNMVYWAFMLDTTIAPLASLAANLEACRRLDFKVLPEEMGQMTWFQSEEQAGRKCQGEATQNPGWTPTNQLQIALQLTWHQCWHSRKALDVEESEDFHFDAHRCGRRTRDRPRVPGTHYSLGKTTMLATPHLWGMFRQQTGAGGHMCCETNQLLS
jgi:hypothetical protein